MRKPWTILGLSLLIFTTCGLTGDEVARLPINEVSKKDRDTIIKEVTLALKKEDKIGIWSDMNVRYEGNISLRFKLEILKNGNSFSEMEIDPMNKNITMGERKVERNNVTNWKFLGKNGKVIIEEDADYTFKAMLVASPNSSLRIDKAELVLKK